MVALNFDATQHRPFGGGSILDTGEYTVQITSSESKETKAGGSGMLVFQYGVLDTEFKGSRLTDRLNIWNQSETVKRIAMEQLTAIAYCCGLAFVQDSNQLHGIPFKIFVTKDKRDDDPEKYTNNIRRYMTVNGGEPVPPQAGGTAPAAPAAPVAPVAAPAPATPAPAAGTPPWAAAPAAAAAPATGTPPWEQ